VTEASECVRAGARVQFRRNAAGGLRADQSSAHPSERRSVRAIAASLRVRALCSVTTPTRRASSAGRALGAPHAARPRTAVPNREPNTSGPHALAHTRAHAGGRMDARRRAMGRTPRGDGVAAAAHEKAQPSERFESSLEK
jgi:hypothetical protein